MAFERLRLNLLYMRVIGTKGLRYPLNHLRQKRAVFNNKDKDYLVNQVGTEIANSDVYRLIKEATNSDLHVVGMVDKRGRLHVTFYKIGNTRNTTTTIKSYDTHYGVDGEFHFHIKNRKLRKVNPKDRDVYDPYEPLLRVVLESRNRDFYLDKAL